MNQIQTPPSKPIRTNRRWTPEQKLILLAEAERTSVHGTAVRHDIGATQLFQWRKTQRALAAALASAPIAN